jgi:hypothetical protein
MMCSHGSLNAVKMLGPSYKTPSKVRERLPCFALPDIALFWARASPECGRASLLAIHVPRGMA